MSRTSTERGLETKSLICSVNINRWLQYTSDVGHKMERSLILLKGIFLKAKSIMMMMMMMID